MTIFRRLPARRLALLLIATVALAAGAAAIAVAASGGSGAKPAPKPLATALHDALSAPKPAGITARIRFTNHLIASGSFSGGGTPLLTGASGRLWASADGHVRLELQSDAGDAQILSDGKTVTVYDSTSNTVYRTQLPQDASSSPDTGAVPTLDKITSWLTDLAKSADVSAAEPDNVAGQEAYTVRVSPSHDGGLLGAAELSFDALQGVPLRAAVYAQGQADPVLELTATHIRYGAVAASDVQLAPPTGAKVVDLTAPTKGDAATHGSDATVTGLDAVAAKVPFTLAAPDTLVGLPRKLVRLVQGGGADGAVVVYGQGLGAIVVLEQKADTATATKDKAASTGLPQVSIDGSTGTELPTALGTVVRFSRGGVTYTLAGSLQPLAAEAAARSIAR